MLQSFSKVLREDMSVLPAARLLIAVSGGVDSVVLCDLCSRSGYSFAIAHCNFQLRGDESARDENFVRETALKYGVELFTRKFDTLQYAKANKLSVQEAARNLRYDFFKEIISGWHDGPSYILTAHHADDNAETLLMNFTRGTGLHGLTGIPASTGSVRRPLLNFTREEIENYAKEHALSYVEDSSNSSDKYTRNHFRLNVIPSIREVYQTVTDNLNNNARRFIEVERLYELAVGKIINKLSRVRGKEIHIPVKQLMEYNNRALIYSIISKYGFSEGQVEQVEKLAESESGHFINSAGGQFRFIRHRHWFVISPVNTQQADLFIIEREGEEVKHDGRITKFEISKNAILVDVEKNKDSNIAYVDARSIAFPLLMRKWKQGDYFYPLGMKKKKKLARFFIDQKLSKSAKENIWVIEMNRKIVWIIGHRIDDRFKITPSTKSVLKITSNPLT